MTQEAKDSIITALDQRLEIDRKYDELLMAVESKFPGETRHQTALRYIKDREHVTLSSTKA